jgi:glycosyltransferase involved in cell wall biosynthesis
MKPEISIIIPALNEEASIGETLESLQNFERAEIILVDGGSTDATVAIAENYKAKILHAPRGSRSPTAIGRRGGERRYFVVSARRHDRAARCGGTNKKGSGRSARGGREFYDSI